MATTGIVCLLTILTSFLLLLCAESNTDNFEHSHNVGNKLAHLTGTEIQSLVMTRKHVLVFLHQKSCTAKCEEHITSLEDVIQEVTMMTSFTGLELVATTDETFMKSFSIQNEMFIAYYRHGVPIIYEDVKENELIHPEDVVEWMARVRTMSVKELTDDTFEHDTQAASGSTTGDWFVMFYRPACFQKSVAKWETLNYRLHGKVVVAKVNVDESTELSKRFNINRCPTFILFRHGKMYEYTPHKYDLDSFANFATSWYKNVKAEKVPLERSPFELITEYVVNFLKRHHGCKEKIAFAAVATIVAVVILVKLTKPAPKLEAKKE